MLAILGDLFRYRPEFRLGALLTGFILAFAALSFVSPYPPQDQFVVPPDVPPSSAYWFGTNSRGQDVFWQLTFAIRNTMLFGFAVAILSRLISIGVGLVAGIIVAAAGGGDAVTAIVNWLVGALTLPLVALVTSVLYFRLKATRSEAAATAPEVEPTDWGQQPAT